MQKTIITISGSPGSGKTTLCMGLNHALSSMGKTVFYAHEWIKDWANRKVPTAPIDQYGVFGNQTMLITSGIKSECEVITSCSSPALCAFYSQYYSDNTRFNSLKAAAIEFDKEAEACGYKVINYFLERDPETYKRYFKDTGRYESLEQSLQMQKEMKEWMLAAFPHSIQIRHDLDVFKILQELS